MGKAESPKLSPAERLARKRAAARLRQQRCRARKRQAMLEKKRGELVRQRCVKLTHDPSRPPVVIRAVHHRPLPIFTAYKSIHPAEAVGAPWAGVVKKGPPHQQLHKTPTQPIYNCVSFDSQKSMEESKQNIVRVSSSPPRSPAQKPAIVVSPSRTPPPSTPREKQGKVVRAVSEEKMVSEEKKEDSLVSEEEAAVAAMLSLKSGSTSTSDKCEDKSKELPQAPSLSPPSPPSSPPREVMISHKSTTFASPGLGGLQPEQIRHTHNKHSHGVRPPQQRRVVPRHFEAYNYGQPMKIQPHSRRAQGPPGPPGYYRMYPHVPPPPHPHYARMHYPPAPPRYIAYDYE